MYHMAMTSRPHTIRLPDELWQTAVNRARRESLNQNQTVTATDVVIASMKAYLSLTQSTQMDVPDASSPTRRKTAEKLTVSNSTTATSFDPAAGTFTTPETAGYTPSATSTMSARDLNIRKGLVDRHGEDSELVKMFDESHR